MLGLVRRGSIRLSPIVHCAKRPFFASSTDHTRLLQEAQVHCLPTDDPTVKQYVLVASGMDPESVKKVPQLHLARLFVEDQTTLYGAKVINKTLGSVADVCGKLVDEAREQDDIRQARSTLHGLSEWVLDGITQNNNKQSVEVLEQLQDSERKAVEAIARGDGLKDADIYNAGQEGWEKLAKEFLSKGLGVEAALYQSKGAALVSVEHQADTSEYADTSGGAMALFSFS